MEICLNNCSIVKVDLKRYCISSLIFFNLIFWTNLQCTDTTCQSGLIKNTFSFSSFLSIRQNNQTSKYRRIFNYWLFSFVLLRPNSINNFFHYCFFFSFISNEYKQTRKPREETFIRRSQNFHYFYYFCMKISSNKLNLK